MEKQNKFCRFLLVHSTTTKGGGGGTEKQNTSSVGFYWYTGGGQKNSGTRYKGRERQRSRTSRCRFLLVHN